MFLPQLRQEVTTAKITSYVSDWKEKQDVSYLESYLRAKKLETMYLVTFVLSTNHTYLRPLASFRSQDFFQGDAMQRCGMDKFRRHLQVDCQYTCTFQWARPVLGHRREIKVSEGRCSSPSCCTQANPPKHFLPRYAQRRDLCDALTGWRSLNAKGARLFHC